MSEGLPGPDDSTRPSYASLCERIDNGNRPRRWWVHRFGSQRLQRAFDAEWGDLARYNAERHRGITHTPAYEAFMADKQARYDEARTKGEL